jgi:hypothetical protein
VPQLVGRCQDLAPGGGVIICHGVVYQLPGPGLRQAGVRILREEPLPFPLGNWLAEFIAGFRRAQLSLLGPSSVWRAG